jgi:hypothetical protein
MWNKRIIFAFGLVALLGSSVGFAQKIVPENDSSTAALVELCSKLDDVDAQNFCFGFGEGVYQSYVANHPNPSQRQFCLPKNGDTREEILKSFLAWNKANPKFNKDPAVKSIIRFFKTQYPCK